MPNREVTWTSLWAVVRARQEQLGWSDQNLYERCNISETVYRLGRQEGRPLKQPHKIAGLEDGLGWQRGSVAAVLAGGEPAVLDAPSAGGDVSQLDARTAAQLQADIAATNERLDALEASLHAQTEAQVARLEDLVSRLLQARPKAAP